MVYGGLICVVPGPGSTSTLNTLRLGETAPLGFTFPWQLWAHWSCHALQTTGPVLAEPRSAVGGGGFACASQMSSEHFGKGLKEKLHVCFSPAKNWSYIHMYIYIYISLSLSLSLSPSLSLYTINGCHILWRNCASCGWVCFGDLDLSTSAGVRNLLQVGVDCHWSHTFLQTCAAYFGSKHLKTI